MQKAFSVLLAPAIFLLPKGSDALWKTAPGYPWGKTWFINASDALIDPSDTAEWNKAKNAIIYLRDSLQRRLDGAWIIDKNGVRKNKLLNVDGNVCLRVQYLNRTIHNMEIVEQSSQRYGLSPIKEQVKEGKTETSYNIPKRLIEIGYYSSATANFVHELTHAAQFETQDIGYDTILGNSIAQDWKDEVDAYKAQFAYDPSTVSGLTSSSMADRFTKITKPWLMDLVSEGRKEYGSTGAATGLVPINIDSPLDSLILACPDEKCREKIRNQNITSLHPIRSIHSFIYKPDSALILHRLPDPVCP